MRTSLKWIESLVPGLDVTPQEYTDAMTMSGSKVEFYEEFDRDLDKIVVGRVEKIEKHPDSDHLVICQVDIGSERVMQKSGLIKEAEHIDYEWHDDRMKTRLEYRLLKAEWESMQK